MSEDTNYKITIEGPGVEITREVSEEIWQKAIVLTLTGASTIDNSASQRAQETGDTRVECAKEAIDMPKISIGEFISEHNATRYPDKIVAIGCYIYEYRGKERFTGDDIKSLFVEAAEKVSRNIARDIRWTLSNNWIAMDPNTKSFYVTQKGFSAVKDKFSKSVIKKTPLPRPTKKASSKKNGED